MAEDGDELDADELLEFLDGRVAKWWLPDDVVFIDEVPEDLGRQVLEEDPQGAIQLIMCMSASRGGAVR